MNVWLEIPQGLKLMDVFSQGLVTHLVELSVRFRTFKHRGNKPDILVSRFCFVSSNNIFFHDFTFINIPPNVKGWDSSSSASFFSFINSLDLLP